MFTVLICCDKFKGSATSAAVSGALGTSLAQAEHKVSIAPLADGGDGTLEAFDQLGYLRESVQVKGSDGELISAEFAFKEKTAVIEIARACGLDLASPYGQPPSSEAAAQASSWGVGDLIRAALDKGARRIILGLGGSATTDAGFGMAQALGVRFYNSAGAAITQVRDLNLIHAANLEQLDPRLAEVEFIIASDVRNPLFGTNGAAVIYGPQKGLNGASVIKVDAAIKHFAAVVEQATGRVDEAHRAGAGAAGGLGFMAMSLLNAQMCAGVDMILDETGGEKLLDHADLVITGEGRIDAQTLSGKAPAGIAERARSRSIPVVAVCGQNQLSDSSANTLFDAIYSLTDYEDDIAKCIHSPLPILERIGTDIARHHLFQHHLA